MRCKALSIAQLFVKLLLEHLAKHWRSMATKKSTYAIRMDCKARNSFLVPCY